ncbi:MAG TPA: hypothetical protein VKQ72_17360, partial [Aggregatilineales bacterium]|nr:hypothetical protein [Aggregatilineales bacterium]
MNPESTNSPNPVIPGSGPAIIRAPILNRVAAVMATWPWWAIVILVGLVAIFYSIFTSVVYTGAFNASVDNFKLSTNRFEVVSYAVRQTDGTTKDIVGTLTSQNNDSVTLITQDEVRQLVPSTDVGSITCDSSTTQTTGAASATACPLNSTVTVTRVSIDGALVGQPSPGQYLITTGYGQTEVIAKIGVV